MYKCKPHNQAIVSFVALTRMLRLRLRTAHGKRYVKYTIQFKGDINDWYY